MKPDPLDSLERFYDACHQAPVPPVRGPANTWQQSLAWSLGGLAVGFACALALVFCVPSVDSAKARQDAESWARMQIAGVEQGPAKRPRAAIEGAHDA